MKIGVVIPMSEDDGAVPSWARISRLAGHAEAGGADSIWAWDHLIYRYPDRPEAGLQEAFTVIAALAGTTRRVEIGSIVFSTSFRPPAMFAKMAATTDMISGGRLILGVGCGWHEPEYQAFGFPFDHRVGRFEEAISIIRPLVRGERVTFKGRWNEVDDCVLLPPPARPIPILIAGKGERMLRLVARHADQWNAAWFGVPNARFHSRIADLRAAFDEEGRDLATIDVTVGIDVASSARAGRLNAAEALPLDVGAIADALGLWAEQGVAHVQVNLGAPDEHAIDTLLEARRRFLAG
jgi:probable F420-dependent oxidoreductase